MHEQQSIDDILNNIRSAIKDKSPIQSRPVSGSAPYDLLELTDVVQDDGSILKIKKHDKIVDDQQIKLSNKIISDSLASEKLLSDEVASESAECISSFVDQLLRVKLFNDQESTGQLNKLSAEVVRPFIQDWLNENLPLIIREILEKEIKDLIAKIKLN